MEKNKIYNLILLAIIFICIVLLIFENESFLTGRSIETSSPSNVSVLKSFSITFSSNLSSGISFGNVAILPVNNQNGTHNYDGVLGGTNYYLNVSEDGNTAVDFCIKGSGNMTSIAADVLGLANETYSNSSFTNSTDPELSKQISFTTTYSKSGNDISSGEVNYYRFWLDIPAAQPSGDYNNTISFKGVQAGIDC